MLRQRVNESTSQSNVTVQVIHRKIEQSLAHIMKLHTHTHTPRRVPNLALCALEFVCSSCHSSICTLAKSLRTRYLCFLIVTDHCSFLMTQGRVCRHTAKPSKIICFCQNACLWTFVCVCLWTWCVYGLACVCFLLVLMGVFMDLIDFRTGYVKGCPFFSTRKWLERMPG